MSTSVNPAADTDVDPPAAKRRRKGDDEDGDSNTTPDAAPSTSRERGRGRVVVNATRSSKKKEKPQPTGPSTWRESTVPAKQKITKTQAKKEYRLEEKDFNSLPSPTKYTTEDAYDSLLYLERDVERKAWEKHGGPELWDIYLAELRERHKKRYPGKPFPEPSILNQPRPSSYANRGPPPRETELRLKFMTHYGSDWIWYAAYRVVEPFWSDIDGCTRYPGGFTKLAQLESLAKALPDGDDPRSRLPAYPRRPSASLSPSEPVQALRQVLERAPRRPDAPEWLRTSVPEGLTSYPSEQSGGETQYDWDSKILSDVYRALTRVVRELDINAWKDVRWEVYDKYVSCIGGLEASRDNWYRLIWRDKAYLWLLGRLEDTHGDHYRKRITTVAGKEYNASLPLLELGQ